MAGYIEGKDQLPKRLRRIEGQVRGLQRMVESETYCIDVLTQISAATKALQAVALELLEDHLAHCVAAASRRGRRRRRGQGQGSLRRDRPPRPLLTHAPHTPGVLMTTTTYLGHRDDVRALRARRE